LLAAAANAYYRKYFPLFVDTMLRLTNDQGVSIIPEDLVHYPYLLSIVKKVDPSLGHVIKRIFLYKTCCAISM
jgi:hypothetical protein